jgi:hypothetical protein
MRAGRWRLAVVSFVTAALVGCQEPDLRRDVVIDYSDRVVGELMAGVEVQQTFVPDHDELSAVAVFLTTYATTPRCKLRFRLRAEGSSTNIVEQIRGCAMIADNSWVIFHFSPLVATRGRRLLFILDSHNGRPGNRVGPWMASNPGIYPEGVLSVGGVATPGALRFATFHR